MAAPTVHESQLTTGTAADPTFTAPSTVQVGDLLLGHLTWDGFKVPGVVTPATGWTLIQANMSQYGGCYGGWWWKIAESGDASKTWVFTGNGNSEGYETYVTIVRGHDATTPINASAEASGSSSGPFIAPSVTTTADDCLIVYSLSRDGNGRTHTPPTGCTEIYDSSAAGESTTAAYKTLATAGSSGTGEFTSVADDWIGHTVAVAPSAGGGTNHTLAGTIAAAAGASGAVARQAPLAGTMAAAASLSSALTVTMPSANHALAGTAAATAAANGSLTAQHPFSGAVAAQAGISGVMARRVALAGTSAAAAGALAGVLGVARGLAGAVEGAAGLSAGLVRQVPLAGQVGAAAGLSATLGGVFSGEPPSAPLIDSSAAVGLGFRL